MSVPPAGEAPQEPIQPLTPPSSPSPTGDDSKYAFLLKSPFAKMFRATGAMPTIKEMRAIMDGILNTVIQQMKLQEAEEKKAQERLKKVIEGQD